MIAKVSNQNFGWSVANDGDWAAVGNPNPFRYDPLSSSIIRTGSIEVYKYNINTDIHDIKSIILRSKISGLEEMLLSTEGTNTGSTGPYYILHTEYTGSVPYTADLDLLIDVSQYYTASEDGYGWSLDLRDTLLAVGNPYFISTFTFLTGSTVYTGSGQVDLFDLSTLDIDPYAIRTEPLITGTGSNAGYVTVNVDVAPMQNFTFVLLQTKTLSIDDWSSIAIGPTSNSGGSLTLQTYYTPVIYQGLYDIRVVGVIGTNPYLMTISNPNSASVSESFGYSVSLNDEWLAVGSPLESASFGAVFMFRKIDRNDLSWSFIQTLPTPTDIGTGDNFGFDIGMNKATSSFSWSMVVGSNKLSSSKAYIYEFNGTNWENTFTLYPNSASIYPLTFYQTLPIVSGYPNIHDSFGHAVAMYGDVIMVGAPTDRVIQEFTGSSYYQQGAVYFFDRCVDETRGYYLARKSYGNEKIMKNNLLGWSVSVYNEYAVAGVPKINFPSASICFLRGSLYQEHFCGDDIENSLNGQYVLYNKATGSIPDTSFVDWDIKNIYQSKKKFLSPYRAYGFDTSISNQFIIIGAPMIISGSNTIMDLNQFTGSFTGSVDILGDLSGKAYIYNLKNLRENFYVGNVFYRNGKIVIMTSGSAFDGLQLSNTINDQYQYEIDFKSKQTVFEKQVVCPIEPGEFNVSTNPTAIILPNIDFDINHNGYFDFQDADVLLKYMAYKSTEATGHPNPDWTSIIDTTTDEELSVYNLFNSKWKGTDGLFTSSYSNINNTLFSSLDFNDDNKINYNDMNILWKYFIYRLTQKNYESYITPSSKKKYLSDILDYMNGKTQRGHSPEIHQNFLDYSILSKQDPTGSYLAPYITSVGLYSGTELVCIAKLGSPIKVTPDFPINIVVKMDF